MTDSDDFDPERLAEEWTDEVIVELSRLLGRDLTDEVSESGLQSVYDEAEQLIREVDTLLEDDVEESEISQFMLAEYNRLSAHILGIDDVEVDSLEGLEAVLDTIDSVMRKFRFQIETLGHPEYYDAIEELADLVIEKDKSKPVKTVIGSLEDIGERKLQRIFIYFEQDLEFILENPDIESEITATEYLKMYERCCEQFKTLSPLMIYSVNIVSGKTGNIEDRLNDTLDTLIEMCLARQRIELLAERIDNDIRNAVAHEDFLIDPVNECVELSMDGEIEVWSYTQIRERVVSARCAALSLLLFPFLLQHRENVRELERLLQEQEID